MKRITIIGMGMGIGTMTNEAWEAIQGADILIGAPRFLALCEKKPLYPCYLPEDIAEIIGKESAQEIAVLVSGDVGFFSAANSLSTLLDDYNIRFLSGISSVNAFFAKLKMPWQNAEFISAHGRDVNIVDAVRRNRLTFCLTGKNIGAIGKALCNADYGNIKTYIGENLGAKNERVYTLTAEKLLQAKFSPLTVLLFENNAFDDRILCGLPDKAFNRLAGIPMTKSEIRAFVLSKLSLRPEDICWDIGAGTGSVTVEMALSAYRGRVYAIERKEEAIPIIEQNSRAFHLGNVDILCGKAPMALEALPIPDAVFIGGSGGELRKILATILDKNQNARIVITAVTIETMSMALEALIEAGLAPEIVQISAARGKQAGNAHFMEAQNPVTIIYAGGKP